MKEIKAFVRRSMMDDVVHGLKDLGVKAMSVLPVDGIGALSDPHGASLSQKYITYYSQVYKIEIVCRKNDAERIVKAIQNLAWTGEAGDGVIFISNIERAIKIRSGEDGDFTLGSIKDSDHIPDPD